MTHPVMQILNDLMKKLMKMLGSRKFATFWVVFVLFVVLAPGMVLDIDGDDLTDPKDWPASSPTGMKNLLQAIPDFFSWVFAGGAKPTLDPVLVQPVLIHGLLAGLLASQLVFLQPEKWGHRIGLGKVLKRS